MFLRYYYSPKNCREIQEISSFLNKTFRQFGGLKNVHWLASRDHALSIIERNYSALITHHKNIAESNNKNAATAKGHVKDLKYVLFVFSLHFMMDYLLKLQSTSLVFQKDDLLVCFVNRIVKSRIDVFEIMKAQPGKN